MYKVIIQYGAKQQEYDLETAEEAARFFKETVTWMDWLEGVHKLDRKYKTFEKAEAEG